MLVYPNNRGVDHLHGRIVSDCQRVHDLVPDACLPPADEAIVAGGMRSVALWQIAHGAPDRKTQNMPLRTRRSSTRGTPRGLLGSIGLMALQARSVSSYRIVSKLHCGSLNHASRPHRGSIHMSGVR